MNNIFLFYKKKIINEYIVPGTSSKQINENIGNDQNIKESNEDYFLYPQILYTLLLQKKNVNMEFIKLLRKILKHTTTNGQEHLIFSSYNFLYNY
jgi:hypothetical protein